MDALRDPWDAPVAPPKPPEHVYGLVPRQAGRAAGVVGGAAGVGGPVGAKASLPEEASLRVTVSRVKAAHTFQLSRVWRSSIFETCASSFLSK